ncbi:MAG: diguanylate cyclase [Defluviitaleaceae bacterium]|nr:diguanylate cyclase [Defluviitaleaceae bacterium]MCL2263301.1 diguanylate cyclase [Defluviitaleaceae bacterium]
MEETIKNSVLIVDDEALNIVALTQILNQEYTVYAEKDGRKCVDAAKRVQPDLILLDVMMPEMNGFEVIEHLKADPETQDIPIVFITGLSAPESEVQGFSLGAVDYIHKPFVPLIAKMRVQNQMKIVNLLRKVKNLSVTDFLTGIGNRRFFNVQLNQEWERAKRQQSPLGFIVLDVDNFKTFNDTHGHLHGDTVLQGVANIIESVITRATDKTARWGGEEFAVILPDTDLAGTIKVAEDIRFAIEQTPLVLENETTEQITVSIGVNCMTPECDGNYKLTDFVADADKAMYHAKANGKNQVCSVE